MTASLSACRPGEVERLAFWLRHIPDSTWLIVFYDDPAVPKAFAEFLVDIPSLAVVSAEDTSDTPPLDTERGVIFALGLTPTEGPAAKDAAALLAKSREAQQDRQYVLLFWLTLEEREALLHHFPAFWSRSQGYFDMRTAGWADGPDLRPRPPIRLPDRLTWEAQVQLVQGALSEHCPEDQLSALCLELYARLSQLYFDAEKSEGGKLVAQELLDISQRQQNRHGMANAYNDLGLYHYRRGEFQQAISLYERALPIWQERRALFAEAVTLANLGAVYVRLKKYPKARQLLEAALSLAQTIGDIDMEATILNHLGGFHNERGEFDQALAYFNQALALRRQAADRRGEGITLSNIGDVYTQQRHFEKAREVWDQALNIQRDLESEEDQSLLLNALGNLTVHQKHERQAVAYFQQALGLWQALEHRRNQAVALENIGTAYYQLASKRDWKAAMDGLKFKMKITPATDTAPRKVDIEQPPEDTENKALIAQAGQQALEAYQEALAIRQELGDRAEVAELFDSMAEVHRMLNMHAEAQTQYAQALHHWEVLGDRLMQAKLWAKAAEMCVAQEDPDQALAACNQAFEILQGLEHHSDIIDIFSTIGKLYEEQSAPERALACYVSAFEAGMQEETLDARLLYRLRDVDAQRALDLAAQALKRRREESNRLEEGRLLWIMGELHSSSENMTQAMDCFTQALEIFQEVGERGLEAQAFADIAGIYERMQERERAMEAYATSLSICRELGDLLSESMVLTSMMMPLLVTFFEDKQKHEYRSLIPLLERRIEIDRAMGRSTDFWEKILELNREELAKLSD